MSDDRTANLADRLRQAGLRPTNQRLALAGLLFDAGDRHVTAEQLFEQARGQAIRVSQATVYNCLNQFTRAGLIREVVVDSGRSYFDTNTGRHHHFYRARTGELIDIPADAIDIGDLPAPPPGTRVDSAEVIIRLADD